MPDQKTQYLLTHFETLLPLIVANVLKAAGALVILLIGIWLAGRVHALVVRMLGRTPHFDEMLRSFFGSLARYSVLTVTVLAVLSQFGIQTTSLVAVLGAAGLAVGLALQGTLSNLAAGVMLLIFRPFRIGHKVQIGGVTGEVRDLSLFWTEIVTEDMIQVIVPNGGVWGQPLRNYSTYPSPLVAGEARFRVPEGGDLDRVLAAARAAAAANPSIAQDPAPTILLDRTAAENALEVVVGFKLTAGDPPIIRSALIRAVHDALFEAPAPAAPPAEG
jgi:small conductance mechanosensitive channel